MILNADWDKISVWASEMREIIESGEVSEETMIDIAEMLKKKILAELDL